MIETLGTAAKMFRWTKPLVLLLGLTSFGIFISTIFTLVGLDSDIYLMPSVLGVLWSALFFFLISTFHRVPHKPDVNMKWFTKIKVRVKRGGYYLLGLSFVVLTLAAIRISFGMAGIWGDTF